MAKNRQYAQFQGQQQQGWQGQGKYANQQGWQGGGRQRQTQAAGRQGAVIALDLTESTVPIAVIQLRGAQGKIQRLNVNPQLFARSGGGGGGNNARTMGRAQRAQLVSRVQQLENMAHGLVTTLTQQSGTTGFQGSQAGGQAGGQYGGQYGRRRRG